MIQTSLTALLIFNLIALLGTLGAIWAVTVWRQRSRERRLNRWRVVCPVCGSVFEDRTKEQVLTCPECGRVIGRQRILDL